MDNQKLYDNVEIDKLTSELGKAIRDNSKKVNEMREKLDEYLQQEIIHPEFGW